MPIYQPRVLSGPTPYYYEPRVLSGQFRDQVFLVPQSSLAPGKKFVSARFPLPTSTLAGEVRTARWDHPPYFSGLGLTADEATDWLKKNWMYVAVGVVGLMLLGGGRRR